MIEINYCLENSKKLSKKCVNEPKMKNLVLFFLKEHNMCTPIKAVNFGIQYKCYICENTYRKLKKKLNFQWFQQPVMSNFHVRHNWLL